MTIYSKKIRKKPHLQVECVLEILRTSLFMCFLFKITLHKKLIADSKLYLLRKETSCYCYYIVIILS